MFWALFQRNTNDSKSLTAMYWPHMDDKKLEEIKMKTVIHHIQIYFQKISRDHMYNIP